MMTLRSYVKASKERISKLIKILIKSSQPEVYSPVHYVRKFPIAKVFYFRMSYRNRRDVAFWRSNFVFSFR